LSTEIENALREYRQQDHERDKLARIEDDIATIKAQIATPESDGGVSVKTESTPAPADTKPNPNAPRDEKVEWIVQQQFKPDGQEVRSRIVQRVQEEYSFSDNVASEYVDLIVDELDAQQHPHNPDIWMWGDQIIEVDDKED
jgi:hypothetical protein